MSNRSPPLQAVDALMAELIERVEMAHELGVAASYGDPARERQRWLTLFGAGNDIAALARSLEILTRPP